MNKIKRLSVIALLLVVVGVVGGFLTYSSAPQQTVKTIEKIVHEEFNSVKITSDNAYVDIIPTGDSVAKIEFVTNGANDSKSGFTSKIIGKTLSITVKDKWERVFKFGFYPESSQHLTIFLPKKQYESMRVENGNGQVQVERLKISDVEVSLINGEVKLNRLTTENIKVDSGNGKIQLKDVAGKIEGSTVNGEIYLSTKALNQPIQLKSANGELIIQTEKEPTNVRFDVSVANGDINILNKYTGSTTIGKGENLIKLTTVNGEVSVTK